MANDFKVVRKRGGIYNVFEVDGLKEIEKELLRMDKESRTALGKQAMGLTMETVKDNVEKNIRAQDILDTGSLLASIRITHGHVKPQDLVCDVRAGTDKRGTYKRGKNKGNRKPAYALQNEFGTEDSAFGPTKERPFMRPAFDGKERTIAFKLREELNRLIVQWKLPDVRA